MTNIVDTKGTAEVLVFEMIPAILFDRVAKGWYNIKLLRRFDYPYSYKITAREFFFKVYGLQIEFTGNEEEHPQYKKDREVIKEVFWETTKNVLEDISQRILNQREKLVSITQNEDELILLDGFLYDWHEARTGLVIQKTKGTDFDLRPEAILLRKELVLKQLNFNSLEDLQTAYCKRLPIFKIIISQLKESGIWIRYFQRVNLDDRLVELSKLVVESAEFLTRAANDLIEKMQQGENGNWIEYRNILELVSFLIFPQNTWRDNSLRDLCFDIYKSTIGDWELYYKPMLLYALSVAGIVAMLLHGDLPGASFILGLLSFGGDIGITISEIISRSELGDLQAVQELEIIETVVSDTTASEMSKRLVISLVAGVILSGIAARLGKTAQTSKFENYIHKYSTKRTEINSSKINTQSERKIENTLVPSKEQRAQQAIPSNEEVGRILTNIERGVDIPKGQGALLGDLMFHKQRKEALKQLKDILGFKLRTKPARTPKGESISPQPGYQSAHATSQSALQSLSTYDPGEMITRFLPTGKGYAHTKFDKYWQKSFREISIRENRTTTTVKELEEVISDAARNSGAFSPAEAESVVGLIQNDLYYQLGLAEDFVLPMPL